jgi:hypothetical protein
VEEDAAELPSVMRDMNLDNKFHSQDQPKEKLSKTQPLNIGATTGGNNNYNTINTTSVL